jgi:hypothetical protein
VHQFFSVVSLTCVGGPLRCGNPCPLAWVQAGIIMRADPWVSDTNRQEQEYSCVTVRLATKAGVHLRYDTLTVS